MGMFDKDRLLGGLRLDVEIPDGVPFILWDAGVIGEIALENGLPPAVKTGMSVSRCDYSTYEPVGEPFTVGTLAGPIAEKVRLKDDDDLPAVVQTFTVTSDKGNDARVIQFVAPYEGKIPDNVPAYDVVTPSKQDVAAK